MIVVVADDLSGAAELAGIAVRHGLSAEVQTRFDPATTADVVCVDTDSRLLATAEAVRLVTIATNLVMAAKPAWIFKKCDSVLRGPVLAEAKAITEAAGLKRCVILPANPSRNRVIRNGRYFINGRPLSETAFAQDPAHPRTTPIVTELLGGDLTGIATPDAASADDVGRIATSIDTTTLPVGAADFFQALLRHRLPGRATVTTSTPLPNGPTLHVCGSAASWVQRRDAATAAGRPVFTLPYDAATVVRALGQSGSVLVGIGDGPATHGRTSDQLLAELTGTVGEILRQQPVSRLLLEGGATAAAVLHTTGWTRLRTLPSPAEGVGVLIPVNTSGPILFIKPGSYPWPENLR